MAGGKFHPILKINAEGRISPRGPLELSADERIDQLYAWVFQLHDGGTGATCIASQQADGFTSASEWTTRADAIHEGQFRPGPAVAMAVSISKLVTAGEPNENTLVYWWSETILVLPDESRPRDSAALASKAKSLKALQAENARLKELLGARIVNLVVEPDAQSEESKA